ncbi:MAG: nitrophenyl compound nitroreductase subunit ArsF family protein [Methanoregula sp.]
MERHKGSYTSREIPAPGIRIPILCMVFFFMLAAGCMATVPAGPAPLPVPSLALQNHTVTKIELIFFHPVPGCDSCERVGLYANETATTYFGPELASGRLVFLDIDLNLPENGEVAHRYGAYTQSLWMGVYDESGFHATEIIDIWYYQYNKEGFMQYLKGVLDRELAGT